MTILILIVIGTPALRDNVPPMFRQSPEDAKAAVAASLLLIVRMLPEGALRE
jgi:hypothetical protein